MLRTTCVATLLDGGHANNALPQRAGANVNCRIFPGDHRRTQVRATLAEGDRRSAHDGEADRRARRRSRCRRRSTRVIGPAEQLLAKYYPGVPLAPMMSTGATDGIFLEAIGIPSYGPPGLYGDPDGNGTHGLNERAIVKAVYTGRDYLYDLVKAYAG